VWRDVEEAADEDDDDAEERAHLALPQRAAAGLGAAGLVAAALLGLSDGSPPVEPALAAAVVGAAVALLPRLAWLATAAALVLWLAIDGRPGDALLVLVAVAPVPILLPRAGTAWSLPAAAPLLGTAALAPGFVGGASLASSAARRAGLAAAGMLWVAIAELLTGKTLLFGPPTDATPRSAWLGSVSAAARDALGPLLTGPALAPLVVCAALAALLPLLVRGRFLALDVLAGVGWAAALVAALAGVGSLLATTTATDHARGAVVGALLGALAAVAAAGVTRDADAPPVEPLPAS
jgi:hypothetical protein